MDRLPWILNECGAAPCSASAHDRGPGSGAHCAPEAGRGAGQSLRRTPEPSVVVELTATHEAPTPVIVEGKWEGKWDNRPTWDNWAKNPASFDNRPTWDNWNKKK
ncbi:multiple cyclophane-containing RiPP AmcA [Streptomyces sp. NPDC088341]|uniref:multiple cyclophane-containing RiPP AmcA n=1 Tax=Streptomyces sp. NPDC088341 TaxID=3154870 RepID=UPI00342C0F08